MKDEENKLVVGFLILALIVVVVSPFAFIWALNTLFNLTIAYGFYEWLAGLIVLGFLKQSGIKVTKTV